MDLRKKILNLEEGLDIYSQLLQDEETILIPFAISQYVTVSRIDELLPEYLADLRRNECKEALCIDLDQMTNVEYWMKKLVKLRSDMERLGTVPMKEHGFVVTILGFSPETTMDLYRAIERNIIKMVEMLTEVQRILTDAPAGLYENFYLNEKAAVDAKPVKARYRQWKREVGVVTSELLKDKEMQELVGILTKKVMRHAKEPSERERRLMDLERVQNYLPHDYVLPKEFPNCYARFCRYAKDDGDTLTINYDGYGQYMYESYYKLTPPERQALIEFDIMLDLIHHDMAKLASADATASREDRIRRSIALLMVERYGDEPLFNQRNHWQAVYRILVDKKICRDSDFDGFDVFIHRVMPKEVNKPYKKESVKQISQTDFCKPFKKWAFDPTTSTLKPFERMVAVAQRFLELLEENGL